MPGGPGRMRSSLAPLSALACLAALAHLCNRPQLLVAPRTSPVHAVKNQLHQAQVHHVSFTGNHQHVERAEQDAAQRAAVAPRRMGMYAPSNGRRGLLRQRNKVNMRASFTAMVKDIAANPRVLLGEIAVVVILSGIFEKLEHKVRQKFARSGNDTGAEIMNALFKEITTLGFVAFVIFLVTHTGTADVLAPKILRDDSIKVHGHNPLSATFETVHMMIFMLLVVLLAQAAAMFFVSEWVTNRWGGYERTVSYGKSKASLESKFVEAGYLQRTDDSKEPGGVKLEQKKPFNYGKTWVNRLLVRGRPLHKLLMWRAIRHEFLFPNENGVLAGKSPSKVPDPALFSFEEYLRTRLGKVVLSLIHVDRWTWVATLGLLAIPLYLCKMYPWMSNEMVHCVMAWIIAAIGLVLIVLLERDTFQLTPKLPTDVPKILKIFSGESFQMLRRAKLPGWKDRPLDGSREESEQTPLELPIAMTTQKRGFFSSNGYKLLFRMLSFFQAVSFTSLLLSHLSSPFNNRAEWAWYLGALVEWPVFLLVIVPVIIRRLTLRSSIAFEKDERLIRQVTTQTKESLLRDYARLVQIVGFEARAVANKEPWTTNDKAAWESKQAIQTVLLGLRKFDSLPTVEKREIWAIFAAWDGNNNGMAEPRELIESFASMGVAEPRTSVDNLIRMVDFDGSSSLNWMKFKAIFGLATTVRSVEEMCEDFRTAFNFLDVNKNGELSIFELADGFQRMNIGIGLDDMANLLFLHFGMAKPTITEEEFVDWLVADRKAFQKLTKK